MEQNKNCKKGCDLKGNRSHDNGGIDAIVDDAGKTVEVESMEYIVCEKAVNDPNIHEYKGTNLQVVKAINKSGGGVDATVTDADGKIVIETGQVVINKKSLSDNTVRSFKGTNKQILSQINQSMGNGVAIYENGGEVDSSLKFIDKKTASTGSVYETWSYNGVLFKVRYSDHNANFALQDADLDIDIKMIDTQMAKDMIFQFAKQKFDKTIFLDKYKLHKNILGYEEIERIGGYVHVVLMQEKKYHKDSIKKNKNLQKIDFTDATKKGDFLYLKRPVKKVIYIKDFYRQNPNIKFIDNGTYEKGGKLKGGLADNKTILDISKKHNVSLDFANKQLEKGILVELEHTDNRDIASEIALDHLSESINYYIELEKMEDKLNEKRKTKTQPKEQNQLERGNVDNIVSIMNGKVKNQGYSLKELYDEVIKLHGSKDGAIIFSEFIKRKKDENDTDIINEFKKTSFVENIHEKTISVKSAANYTNEDLTELCKQADINKETLVFDVPDDKIEYYKSLGFVVKNE